MNKPSSALFASLVLAACTTIPNRFATTQPIVGNCGYVIEAEDGNGFVLEVAHKEYSFFPSSDPIIVAARSCFSKTATELARRKGKTIVPLTSADMNATANRNVVDGQYLVHVVGKVRYANP